MWKRHAGTSISKHLRPLARVGLIALLAFAAPAEAALIKDITPDTAGASGYAVTLVDFAHTTDVHITDEGNPIRAEELKVIWGYNPALYPDIGWLLYNLIPPTHRDIGAYTALVWQATIASLNDAHLEDALDFLISTGDHTDTGLKDELAWFVALADGLPLPGFKGHANRAGLSTKAPSEREALLMPWFAAVGNHDVEYQGTFNSSGVIGILVQGLFYAADRDYYMENLSYLDDVLSIESGHGLAGTEAGYYGFDPTPYVHCIVLNTAIFNPEDKAPLETLSLGMLSRAQFDWMEEELIRNFGKLCIIFAHHGPDEFAPLVTDMNTKYVSAGKLKESLKTFENVIAFVSGHTHVNRVTAETDSQGQGYWDINTCGVADWPQEWRRMTIKDNGDGTGTLVCRMHTYDPEILTREIYRIWDPLAGTYLDPAYGEGESIREVSAAENETSAAGAEADRDVELLFAIPAAVKDTIVAAQQAATSEDEGGSTAGSGADGDGDDHDGRCFIATSSR